MSPTLLLPRTANSGDTNSKGRKKRRAENFRKALWPIPEAAAATSGLVRT